MMELAFEADIEYSQIAKIERGVINTTISTAHALAIALNIHPKLLFDFTVK
jgi:transcriptional regulator with XRE-family HTH domain